MSLFSNLLNIADDDVKVILGEEKVTDDSLIDYNSDKEELANHLDEVEERNATTIEIMKDVEIATESSNLKEKDFLILKSSLKAITGVDFLHKVNMESYDSSNSKTLAMEGIKEALKKFWEYIKSALKKFWNYLKKWWYKTFDISKRAKRRAEKIMEKADKEYGVSTENEITFQEIKRLAVNGKTTDIPAILNGLSLIEQIVFEFIENRTSDKFNDSVDNLSDSIKSAIEALKTKADELVNSNLEDDKYKVSRTNLEVPITLLDTIDDRLKAVFNTNDSSLVNSEAITFPNSEKYKKQFTGGIENTTIKHSDYLPGDKWVLSVTPPKPESGSNIDLSKLIDYIRYSKFIMADSRYGSKVYDSESSVKVLQPSSISRGCESIIEICNHVNEYKQSFERRDRFKERIVKDIDQTVNDVTSDNDSAYSEVDRLIRSFANSITGLIRRRSDFETSLCAYSLSVSVVFLNYSELSLNQYSG